MDYIINKPHILLWATILILLFLGMPLEDHAIDIHIHDTYYVVDIKYASILISCLLVAEGLLYWVLRNHKKVNWMTLVHVVCSTTLFISIITLGAINYRTYVFVDFEEYKSYIFISFLLLFLISQTLFVINIIISTYRNKPKTN